MRSVVLSVVLVMTVFAVASFASPGWEVPITAIFNGDTTSWWSLVFAKHPLASDLLDTLDCIIVIAPPMTMFGYFPISDPENPYITMLQCDYRDTSDTEEWEIRFGMSPMPESIRLSWDVDSLPPEGTLEIGYAEIGSEVEEWVDMRSSPLVVFGGLCYAKIRYEYSATPEDTVPPIAINWDPEDGAVDVPVTTDLEVDIIDSGSGVDPSTVRFVVMDYEVPSMLITATPIPFGYHYLIDSPVELPGGMTIEVIVYASDLDGNSMSDTISFTTERLTGYTVFGVVTLEGETDFSGTQVLIEGGGVDTTEVDGSYRIEGVPAGTHMMTCIHEGFNTDIRSITVTRDTTINIELTRIEETATVSGTVYLEDSPSDLSGSVVSVWNTGMTELIGSDTTDTDGSYSIPDIPTGVLYAIVATHPGYRDSTDFAMVDEDITVNFTLYREVETYRISGIVLLEGDWVSSYGGTTVMLDGEEVGTTEIDGSYSISDVSDGWHVVAFAHPGYAPAESTFAVTADVTLDMMLSYYYRIYGHITLEGETDHSGTGVYLEAPGVGLVGADTTGSDGWFELTGIFAGDYTLTANHPGFEIYTIPVSVTPADSAYEITTELVSTVSETLFPPRNVSASEEYIDRIVVSWEPPHMAPPPGIIDTLLWDDGTPDDVSGDSFLGFGGAGGGLAVRFTPPSDSCYLIGIQYFTPSAGASFEVHAWDDGGGVPGDDMFAPFVTSIPTDFDTTGEWLTVELPNIPLTGYNFYVGWIEIPPDVPFPAVGMDTSYCDEHVSFVYHPDYGMWFSLNEDFTGFEDVHLMMRAIIVTPDDSVLKLSPSEVDRGTYSASVASIRGTKKPLAVRRRGAPSFGLSKALSVDATILGYNIYRAETYFTDTSEAELVGSVPSGTYRFEDTDPSLEMGVWYYYGVTCVYDEGESFLSDVDSGMVAPLEPPAQILIYDFDDGDMLACGGEEDEADFIYNALLEVSIPADSILLSEEGEPLDHFDLSNYQVVFIVTGAYPQSTFSDEELTSLMEFLDGGGRLYIEGVDVGYCYGDPDASSDVALNFFDMLGAVWEYDGESAEDGNVVYLDGTEDFFGMPLHLNYDFQELADHYVDELSASEDATVIMTSQETGPAPSVTSGRVICYANETYVTVLSSVYLGAMQDDEYPNLRTRVLGSVLNALGIPNSYAGREVSAPDRVVLFQNYPNPFNPATGIKFYLPEAGSVELSVYNIRGEKVCTLVSGNLSEGTHSFVWDGKDAPSGVYLYRLRIGNESITKKMMLLK